jgi:isoquinoline 1-oxidoreductase beta subunit
MSTTVKISRRTLLKGGLAVGAGLTVGFYLPPSGLRVAAQGAKVLAPNAFVRIDADGIVTIMLGQAEMGQGIYTSVAMIIADELDADWSKVKVEQAPPDPAYGNPAIGGRQSTVASASVRGLFIVWRKAAAAAREMLLEAAAKELGVPASELTTDQGVVYHRPSGRKLTYAELADKAAQLPVPQDPKLKSPDQFKIIGKNVPRMDTPPKVSGRAVYGIDVKVPGMLVATVARSPVLKGKAVSFDATKAKAVPGVKEVVQIGSGVAVVADSYWAAKKGGDALTVTWDDGPLAQLSNAEIRRIFENESKQPGVAARKEGEFDKAFAEAPKKLEAVYDLPYLAHATMEPMNCTAHVRANEVEVWVPTQAPDLTKAIASKVAGVPPQAVKVHTTFLGGGFGRRAGVDFLVEAVQVSKAVGAPVKVIWSREDDTRHGSFRPMTYNVLRAALDSWGRPVAWSHKLVSQSIFAQLNRPLVKGIDPLVMEGAHHVPYDIPNIEVNWIHKEVGVPVTVWRSIGNSTNIFVVESFIDELAHAAGKDPLEYRLLLLGKAPIYKGVLELAARRAGWGSRLPAGRYRGIAVANTFGGHVAEVAEVSVTKDGKVRVHKVVAAVDAGTLVNPDQVKAQIEGGIVYGLTAALYGRITIDKGRVVEGNFDTYKMLRINEMPQIEVHLMPSTEPPRGIGEAGVPPIAPAVTNAIFAATGKRLRQLPIRPEALART